MERTGRGRHVQLAVDDLVALAVVGETQVVVVVELPAQPSRHRRFVTSWTLASRHSCSPVYQDRYVRSAPILLVRDHRRPPSRLTRACSRLTCPTTVVYGFPR